MNSKKPTATSPMHAEHAGDHRQRDAAAEHRHGAGPAANVNAHSSSEPSCPPHTAENRYQRQGCVLNSARHRRLKVMGRRTIRSAARRREHEQQLQACSGR